MWKTSDKVHGSQLNFLNDEQQEVIRKYTADCESEKHWTNVLIGLAEIAQYTIIVIMSLMLLVTTYLGFAHHRGDIYPGEVMRLQGEVNTLRSRLDAVQNAERDFRSKAPMDPPSKALREMAKSITKELDTCNRKLDQLQHGRYSDILLPVILSQTSAELEDEITKDLAESVALAPAPKPTPEAQPEKRKPSETKKDKHIQVEWLGFTMRLTPEMPAGYCAGLNLMMSLLMFVWGFLETIQRRFHWRERRLLSGRSYETIEQLKDTFRLLKLSDEEVQSTVRTIVKVRKLYLRNRQSLESEPPSLSDFNNLSSIGGPGATNGAQRGNNGRTRDPESNNDHNGAEDPVPEAEQPADENGQEAHNREDNTAITKLVK